MSSGMFNAGMFDVMQLRALSAFLLAALTLIGAPAEAQVLTLSQLRQDPNGVTGECVHEQTIDVGGGVKFPARLKQTTKGNGALSIANLQLRVIDGHDDGALYAGEMPHVEFADLNDDGFKDLVVGGIVEYTDEKGDFVRDRESFVFIYRYDPKTNEFRRSYRRASFNLEDGPRAKPTK